MVTTTEAVRITKLQSYCHHQQTNIKLSYRLDGLPVAQPNSVRALNGESITFHGFAQLKLTLGLSTSSLTTKASWFTMERVAKPLVSRPTPVASN